MLLGGCVFISSGNRIKLDRYTEIKQETLGNLSLSYKFFDKEEKENKKYLRFLPLNFYKGKNVNFIKEFKEDTKTKCTVRVFGKIRKTKIGKIKNIYRNISAITFEILPFFWINSNYAKFQLIENESNKVLKEHSFKENLYELRSFFLIIPGPWWNKHESFTALDWGGYQQSSMYGHYKYEIQNKLSEVLTRKIVNDAANFKECRK